MHGRENISSIFCSSINRFINDAPKGYEFIKFAVVTGNESVKVCNEYGFDYIQHQNEPLGKKWNEGLNHCIKNYDFDYVLIMGDDDIISSEAWKYYDVCFKNKVDYFGFSSIYFYSTINKECLIFNYNKFYKLVGCGRMISLKAIKECANVIRVRLKVDYNGFKAGNTIILPFNQASYLVDMNKATQMSHTYFRFWNDNQNNGLDNESELNLLSVNILPYQIKTKEPLMLDIKSSKNITDFNKLKNLSSICELDSIKWLSSEEKQKIIAL